MPKPPLKWGGKRELVTFEMFKPKLSDSNQTLSFKVRGIGKKNKDLLTGLRNNQLSDASLFIDDALTCLPDCEGVDLSYVDLSYKDLTRAELSDADLFNADLRYANLYNAYLTNANLYNANLKGAILTGANLTGANLKYAWLTDAILSYANLTGANLTGADLDDANLSYPVNLTGADLTGAKNMDDAILDGVVWNNTRCPDGTINSGTSPCTAEQLIPLQMDLN